MNNSLHSAWLDYETVTNGTEKYRFLWCFKKKKIYISKNNHMQDPYFGPFFSPFLVVVLFQFCFLFSLSPCIFLHLDQDSFI